MTLQVIPPELLEVKDKIETKEPQPYWKASSLKDGESVIYGLTVTSLLVATQALLLILHVRPTGPNLTGPKLTERSSSLVVSLHG